MRLWTFLVVFAVLGAFVLESRGSAEIYMYRDKNGSLHFSNAAGSAGLP